MTRLEKLRAALPAGCDGIIVTNEINQRYLTGFAYTDGYVLVTRKAALLLCDFRYIEAARASADPAFEVRMFEGGIATWMPRVFDEFEVRTVAYEYDTLSCSALDRLKNALPGREFIPAETLLSDLREFKDDGEIEKIIAAQRIAEQALEHIIGFINPDRTEVEIALELEFFMRAHGAKSTSFDTIAVSGSASSLPHGEPRPVKLERGFLTMDFGALKDGYCSDMTRTVVLGKADAEMKRIYDTVLTAQTEAFNAIREGITGREVDAVARDIIYGAGYEGCFGHGLGHGVGMEIHEEPRLSPMGGKKLARGHVVTDEPGIYIEGKYGCRIEDMIVIYNDGRIEDITLAPHELIEI